MTNAEQYNLRKLINNHFFDRDQTKDILENFVSVDNQGVLHVGLPEPTSVALTTPNNAITTADMGTLKATVTGASNVKCYGVPVEFVNKKTQQVLGYGLTDLNGEVYHNFRLDDADIFDVQARLSQDYLFNDFAVLNNTHTWNNNSNIVREIYEDHTKIYLDDDTSYGYLCSPVLSGFVDIDFKVKLNDGAITDTFCGLFTTNSTGTVSGTINGFNLGQLGLTSSDIGRWVDFHIGVLDDTIILLCKDTGAMVKLTHTCPSYYIFCFALTGTLTDLDFRDVKINKCSDDLTMFVKDKTSFIELYGAENKIIQSGDTLNVWAFVTDNNYAPVENEEVILYTVVDGVETVYGSSVTDSMGIAYLSYVGSGVGNIGLKAKCGSLVSEIYELFDCLKYDNATSSDPKNIWSTNNATLERKTEYSRIYETTTGTDGNLTTQVDHSICIETDIQLVSTDYSKTCMALGQSLNALTRTTIALPSSKRDGNWHHVKIIFTNGTGTVAFDEDSPSNLIINNYDSTGDMYFRFVTGYDITEINFKNWKCYPI